MKTGVVLDYNCGVVVCRGVISTRLYSVPSAEDNTTL